MQAKTIDEVIDYLDEIIETARATGSRTGYFAALYKKVTVQVKEKTAAGYFDDNERMEKLDVIFANRYLAAYTAYRDGGEMSKSWQVAFAAANKWRPIVLQHLLVGMNAHINLDLGIAAAEVAPGDQFESLHDDFNKINTILSDLVNDVKEELSQIWPMLRLIDKVMGNAENVIINFSMEVARDMAWSFGKQLAPADDQERQRKITTRDKEVALFGEEIVKPPFLVRIITLFVRIGERGDVTRIIAILND